MSAETLAALRALERQAACGDRIDREEARAIREHIAYLTTRYQRAHVERERAERRVKAVRDAALELAAQEAMLCAEQDVPEHLGRYEEVARCIRLHRSEGAR